jgi:hypothetical protein
MRYILLAIVNKDNLLSFKSSFTKNKLYNFYIGKKYLTRADIKNYWKSAGRKMSLILILYSFQLIEVKAIVTLFYYIFS